MSLITEAKREHKKLSSEIGSRQRRLRALENVIYEFHPGTTKLYELVIDCLRQHQGHAAFAEIVDFLTMQGVDMPKQKISLFLTANDNVKYDKAKKQWEMSDSRPSAKA